MKRSKTYIKAASCVICTCLAFALVFFAVPAKAFADDPILFRQAASADSTAFVYYNNEYYKADGVTESGQGDDVAEDSQEDAQDCSQEDSDDVAEDSQVPVLPTRFMLTVDKLTSTSVKDQGRVGTCWAFGPIAAAESSLINDGLAQPDIDFSEKHMAWFAHTPISASATGSPNSAGLASKIGSGYSVVNYDGSSAQTPATGWKIMNLGGVASGVYKMLATGQGLALEAAYPYNVEASDASSAATTGNWYIDDNQRFTAQTYDLTDYNVLPPVYVPKRGTSAVGIQAVKSEIARGRCVATGIHVGDTARELSRDSAYTKDGYCYMYTYNEEVTNHEVTIVGYDDNIPATTFTLTDANGAAQTPPANGAFLVKDSAGTNFALRCDGTARTAEEKSASTGGGYYWVSYYDKGIYEQISCQFKQATGQECYTYDVVANPTNIVAEYIQEYDEEDGESDDANKGESDDANKDKGDEAQNDENVENKSDEATSDKINEIEDTENNDEQEQDPNEPYVGDDALYEANIYTATQDIKISDVSFETLGDADTVTVQIRVLNADDEGNFPKITTVEPAEELANLNYTYGGYHRATLNNPVVVSTGNKFAVAITHHLQNGHYALPYTTSAKSVESKIALNNCYLNCSSNLTQGQSVVFYENKVADLVDVTAKLDQNYACQNFTLNAYTSPATQEDFDAYQELHKQPTLIEQIIETISKLFN